MTSIKTDVYNRLSSKIRVKKVKIKLIASDENYDKIAKELTEKGIELSDFSNLVLTEQNSVISHIIGKKGDAIYRLDLKTVSHFESFAHDVIAYTNKDEYKVNETLKSLTTILDPNKFIRISNSCIISVDQIENIKPAFTQKFIITMKSGYKVDVTRSYYYSFKEFIGI